MNFDLVKDVMDLVKEFQSKNKANPVYTNDVDGFKLWVKNTNESTPELNWEGKEFGRTPDSIINTLIVHINHYAKAYSKSAIYDSKFSTQDDFIFLISLKVHGPIKKMDLVKLNKQEKPVGIKIINRLISNEWVEQKDSKTDKRSKIIQITQEGLKALKNQMDKIRKATQIVTGDLSELEKIKLIELLQKLNEFHQPIYDEQLDSSKLLDHAYKTYLNKQS
ncbi:MarR family transcriptional regulator [Weeksellaceae bacterium KMM 9713]|uniref:MarR family transcriptional regulator n=1 Tax=Profundicola chukchiensis TaxID=2961959 RepID=A0A9X4N3E9_9FLAO|nr:MarR family transcriptional regulator [Profundicola chukchiensis]MDG4946209.1 MarR family transcriptional regulator [Profundicola chukchiensis]